MMSEGTTTIEIDGVKLEVDLRTARKVESFRVGDRVKLLTKDYSGYKSHVGAIVAFDLFKKLPTIVVAYIDNMLSCDGNGGKLSFAYLNSQSKDVEICPMVDDDVLPTQQTIIAYFDRSIATTQKQLEEIAARKEYFLRQYGTTFGVAAAEVAKVATGDATPQEPF